MEWVVAGVVGLLTGFVGPLVAPWAQWRVAEAKDRVANRRQLIAGGRAIYAEVMTDWHSDESTKLQWGALSYDGRMLALLPHLDPEVQQLLRGKTSGALADWDELQKNLDRLEQRWKLT